MKFKLRNPLRRYKINQQNSKQRHKENDVTNSIVYKTPKLIHSKLETNEEVSKSNKSTTKFNNTNDVLQNHNDNTIDDLFNKVKLKKLNTNHDTINKLKSKDKTNSNQTLKPSLDKIKNVKIINPEAPLERIDKQSGLPVYKAHILKVGEGGGTPLCPFDCNCCF